LRRRSAVIVLRGTLFLADFEALESPKNGER
jgi:hypothetical protein